MVWYGSNSDIEYFDLRNAGNRIIYLGYKYFRGYIRKSVRTTSFDMSLGLSLLQTNT